MAITATNTGGGHYEPVPAGTYVARCYQMVHIGTVMDSFNGENKLRNKVRITWELPTETKSFGENEEERPFSIGKEFTLSMHERSGLRKFLESWRGKAFTEEQSKAFDITVLLGVPCMLNVIHKTSKDGQRVYAEIASISPMPKGLECPAQHNVSFHFGYEPFNSDIYDTLPDWLKDKVKQSLEYEAAVNPSHTTAAPDQDNGSEDDLPF